MRHLKVKKFGQLPEEHRLSVIDDDIIQLYYYGIKHKTNLKEMTFYAYIQIYNHVAFIVGDKNLENDLKYNGFIWDIDEEIIEEENLDV